MPTSSSICFDPASPGLPAFGFPDQTRLLVIGYGNVLFGDDGIGPHIAEQVAAWQQPGVHGLAVPLLTPELSPLLTAAELAVFVDATLAPTDRPQLVPLHPAVSSAGLGHAATPAGLLALAVAIFGRSPPAWILSVPAADFSLGQNFSNVAQRGAERALCQLRHLAQGLAGRSKLTSV